MAEMIWNGVVTVYDFIMDNIVIINILFALIIVFFQRRSPQTVWDMASSALFYTDTRIHHVSGDRTGFSQKPDV